MVIFVVTDRSGVFCGAFKTRELAQAEIDVRAADPWYSDFAPHSIDETELVE